MKNAKLYESDLEEACLRWFADLDYEVLESHNVEPDSVYEERREPSDVILEGRLRAALDRLNPEVPPEAVEEALRRIRRRDAPTLEQNNQDFHRLLTDGVTVEISAGLGRIQGVRVRIVAFEEPELNDWVVAHQVSVVDRVTGTGRPRTPDVVVWVNGLPLAVIELKNPASEQADIWQAYEDLQIYKRDIPSLFHMNALLVVSDDILSRIGSLTAERSRFQPWRAIENEKDLRVPAEDDRVLDKGERLQALIAGVFHKERFLDLVRHFTTFERGEHGIVKKVAAYHQFHAVRAAMAETIRATKAQGDRRIGVVWHTQGSGKSLTMLFYAGKLVVEPAMENPTIVVITDRNDLDDQLFGVFAEGEALLRQKPIQARDRDHLRDLLRTASGGVYFTTIQKFLPEGRERQPCLTDRRNVVVIADEAHRSQYGLKARVDVKKGRIDYGFAKHMRDTVPNASFIGFTGTPVTFGDKHTVKVFGDYVSVYDIRHAVEDHATVPIYYENRLANLELDERKRPKINPDFDEATEGEEAQEKERLKTEWSTLEALVGTPKRLQSVAADLVDHFEKRNQALNGGKAMVVCMSRAICAELYEEITKLRPAWHATDDDDGEIKVVFTGSETKNRKLEPHLRSQTRQRRIAERFKNPQDSLRLVLVRDMWLTGFDAPCLHTLYVDKPMQGHNLMQAIARVNRVFGDKPGGLIVDYIGIASFLKDAMRKYAQSGGKGEATVDYAQALGVFEGKLELCRAFFEGFDYRAFFRGNPQQRLDLLPAAREHILQQRAAAGHKARDPHERFLGNVAELTMAAGLVSSTSLFQEVRDEVAFFQAVRAGLVKLSSGPRAAGRDVDHAVRQIVANAIVSDRVIDIFSAAGLPRPDLSVLSDEFLAEIRHLPHKNLAAAVLERLLRNEIRTRRRTSLIQARSFEELLERAVRKYLGRSIEAAQMVDELIEMARQFRQADAKGTALGLTTEEFAFYEALSDNESAREVLGDAILSQMAHELTRLVRQNATIDWTQKRSVQAKLRALVKRLLRRYKYPPDAELAAMETVLEQAKLLGINVTDGGSESPADPGEWSGATEARDSAEVAERPLPYPIAVFDSLVASQDSGALRVKTRVDGIERAVAFAACCAYAWLRDRGGKPAAEAEALIAKGGGRNVAAGTWVELAWRLGALLPRDEVDPVVLAGRAFVDQKSKPSPLAQQLQKTVVPYRNKYSHGVVANEEAVLKYEAPMTEVWRRLLEALGPLRDMRLVSRVKIIETLDDGKVEYETREHSGPEHLFRLGRAVTSGKLHEGWTYLLRDEAPPLSLAPFLRCDLVPESGQRDLFLARAVGVAAGTKGEFMAISSDAAIKVKVP